MEKAEYIEKLLSDYEKRVGLLPAHNKNVLRDMLSKDFDWWENEEGRVLNDSNRYPEG